MIICSAIKFNEKDSKYPIIMTGLRHPDIYQKMGQINYEPSSIVEGFLNDSYSFLDRYEAKHEARAHHQLIEDSGYRALYSEDIWPE